jgi:hypothetical protein
MKNYHLFFCCIQNCVIGLLPKNKNKSDLTKNKFPKFGFFPSIFLVFMLYVWNALIDDLNFYWNQLACNSILRTNQKNFLDGEIKTPYFFFAINSDRILFSQIFLITVLEMKLTERLNIPINLTCKFLNLKQIDLFAN